MIHTLSTIGPTGKNEAGGMDSSDPADMNVTGRPTARFPTLGSQEMENTFVIEMDIPG